MGNIKNRKKISSKSKLSNIKPCQVIINKLKINKDKACKSLCVNQEQNDNLEICGAIKKGLIRKCKVKLYRLKRMNSISTESHGDIESDHVLGDNHLFIDDKHTKNSDRAKETHQNIKISNNITNMFTNSSVPTVYKESTNNLIISPVIKKKSNNPYEDIGKLKTKYNINKEIQIKLVKFVIESENLKNRIITDFIEENDENDRNINKRKRGTLKINDNDKDYHLSEKTNIDKLHCNEKGILRNIKQNQVDQIITDNRNIIITRRRRNILLKEIELGRKSDEINLCVQENSSRKNKKNKSVKDNSTKKINTKKLNKILEKNDKTEIINETKSVKLPETTSDNDTTTNIIQNTNNYDFVPIDSNETSEIKKETFFRGLRGNKMSNINESEFRLAENIQEKQKSQKSQSKNSKISSKKVTKELCSTMENEASRETEENEIPNQVIENPKNIEVPNKIVTKKDIDNEPRTDSKKLMKKNGENVNLVNEQNKWTKSKNNIKSKTENRKAFIKNNTKSNIFDFESSESSSELIPNKNENDIIKKLVEQGKAEIANYKKGTGRLNLKRNKKPKVPLSRKQPIINKEMKHNDPTETKHNVPEEEHMNEEHMYKEHMFLEKNISTNTSFSPKQKDIGYSPIARRAMNKHAHFNSTGTKRVMDKKKLLEFAKSFLARTSNSTQKNDNATITQKNSPTLQKRTVTDRRAPVFDASTPWRSPNIEHNFNYHLSPTKNSNNKPLPVIFPNYSLENSFHENRNSQSFNLSNIENIHPVNENSVIETNPRKVLTNRTPLKNINIIEVINLPPLALQNNKYNNVKDTKLESEKNSLADIFNFDEIITNTDNNCSNLPISTKQNLNDKLKKLKRLLPHNDSNSISKPTRMTLNTFKKICQPKSPVKQKNIQEMLCSTMIDENKRKDFNVTIQKKIDETRPDNTCNDTIHKNYDCGQTELHLFEDISAESTTLNHSMRTYSRTKKRKKMRHEFITWLSSDSEEEEENIHHKRTKKTRGKKCDEVDDELTNFYKEFNAMTDDIDQIELITVPDT